MSTFTGIILDVSGSMQQHSSGRSNEKGGEWTRSVFEVIDDLVKHDLTEKDLVFAIGVGGCGDKTFDILKTVKQFQESFKNKIQFQHYDDLLQKLYTILENGGARTIRNWAQPEVIKKAVDELMAALIFDQLQSDAVFLQYFVYECLPFACRNWTNQKTEIVLNNVGFIGKMAIEAFKITQHVCTYATTTVVRASEENVKEVEKKAKSYLLKPVEDVYSVHEASKIVHGYVDDKTLTEKRLDELMEIVKPFIYGSTPLFRSLREASKLFLQVSEHNKLLFVLSDGCPSDKGSLMKVLSELRKPDVTIVTCFIAGSDDVTPRRLFSEENPCWKDGAKFMFGLSTSIPTNQFYHTYSIFLKRGWQIDITNNETRLFIQVNHPDHIHDACDLAKTVVCSQDALSDLLMNVSLDMYINSNNESFKAKDQGDDETCYAFVAATVIHLSINRIVGREGGYPDFDDILCNIIQRYGTKKESTFKVLQQVCPEYRLKCRQIDIDGALKAIREKRPVVAIYRLTDDEMQLFSDFFYYNKTGILSKQDIDITKRSESITPADLNGHAVVLTSFNAECLRLMSSYGDGWADCGFFRVQNAQILDLQFIDVFWESNSLTFSEKTFYKEYGKQIAQLLIFRYTGLQNAEYKCPICKTNSLVSQFVGSLKEAACPKCNGKFPCVDAGNILAMNIYLTSLASF